MNTDGADRTLAIAADGSYVAYVIDRGATTQGQLIVRAIDRLEPEQLGGITGARAPFFSPDGQWVGFFQAGELKRVRVTGGPPITLCKINNPPRGGSWGSDNTIVFATFDPGSGLFSVPAGGGEPVMLTRPDTAHGEADHLFPEMLPDGRAVLFTITALDAPIAGAQIAILDLETRKWTTVIRGGSQAEYVEPGYLVYAASGALRAVRFDPGQRKVLGDPVPIVENVTMRRSGAAEFSISRSGTLVYAPGSGVEGAGTVRSLVWANRQGNEVAIAAPARSYWTLRLSPDSSRIAVEIRDQDNDIWIWDGHALTRLTSDPELDVQPLWTRDGLSIVFGSARAGFSNLFWQKADGTGTVERLTNALYRQWPTSVTPDGTLVITEEKAAGDISLLSMQGKRTMTPLLHTLFSERNGEVSPDGHWIAYQSNESGEAQVYVKPFPNVDAGRWTISGAGGTQPAWAPDGRELFYIDDNNSLTSVPIPIQTSTSFKWGTPTALFKAGVSVAPRLGRFYDVARDGRFVLIKDAAGASANQTMSPPSADIVLVVNWIEELKKKSFAP